MPKKILVTGSNGLLGQKLVEQLVNDKDVELIATSRGANRLKGVEGYRYIPMNIVQQVEVQRVILEVQPEVIIHTAAMTNVDQCETSKEDCWAQNVYAVQYLAEAAKNVNAYFLHLSTDFIFDGLEGPYSETTNANPVSFYGWSKWAAEKILLHDSVLNYGIARTVLVYGIAQDMSRSNIVLWVKKSLEEGKKINVVTDQWRTPTLAEDLAAGCLLMAKKEAKGIYNISGKDFLNPYEMAIKTADFFHLDKSLISKASAATFSQTAKRPPKTGFIIDKAIKNLGYSPKSFEEGIALLASQISS